MGSSSSKTSSSCSSSSSSCSLRKGRSKRYKGFPSYCLGTTSGSRDSDNDDQVNFVFLFSNPMYLLFVIFRFFWKKNVVFFF